MQYLHRMGADIAFFIFRSKAGICLQKDTVHTSHDVKGLLHPLRIHP